ncbi:peptidoglycan-binding protein [Streptomyces boncukensis]|uniref:N-acetylmuramoyl-L-alanine amidase n=1 Tax=Streptomyces boncukensis TaxID=2711219 RepID=A0A6G4X5P3_9ACTN|nr:peptidoglycan-binding protein [Streptomyces boncukensis]NGO72859.1 N-acetylmuramoyl-L-alanine amidase [Streptomyces boncukensis]
MATPLTADRLLAALRGEGVKVVGHRSWRTHHRNAKGAWGPINGVLIHHTVTRGTDASVQLCYDGYSGLPGPLCHGVIAKDGTVHLVGNGRANHAGLGDPRVLNAVIREDGSLPPARSNTTDGNARFYGFECVNLGDGKDPWPGAQLEAIERAAAAVCRAYGWSAESVIGHKEWQHGKVDPRGFSMAGMRRRIAARLGSAPDRGSGSGSGKGYQPFPGASWFHRAPKSAVVTAMGRRLVAEGCSAYSVGPGPQWTDADRRSYARWQHKLGYRGADADGWPGAKSWAALKVPRS